MRIPIINAKGGVTKTTSAIYLALAAARNDQPVEVLDADVQGHASLWAYAAEDAGTPLPFPVTITNIVNLERLKPDDSKWMIIDAAPSGKIIDACIRIADYIIIPTSDSPMDLQQVRAVMDIIPPEKPCAVLVTKAQRNTKAFSQTVIMLDDAEHQGAEAMPRFETVIPMRQDIKRAMGSVPSKLYEYGDAYVELKEDIARRKERSR